MEREVCRERGEGKGKKTEDEGQRKQFVKMAGREGEGNQVTSSPKKLDRCGGQAQVQAQAQAQA